MKKIFLLSLVLIFSAIIYAQQTGPAISWISDSHDFGTITEDAGVQEWNFEFVNTGNEPLELKAVKPSCGCTSADWTKSPIGPGEKGFVKASYDPKGRGHGNFNKSITITTNEAQPTSYLRISGNVLNPNPETAPAERAVTPPAERFDRTIQPTQTDKKEIAPDQQQQQNLQSKPAIKQDAQKVKTAKEASQGQQRVVRKDNVKTDDKQ
jgi:hypothetical protein